MIDHVSIALRNLDKSAAAYERVLATLGLRCLVVRESAVGFGKSYPEFWLNARPSADPLPAGSGNHVCLRAIDEESVRAFHSAAVGCGFSDDGAPGPRHAEMNDYFGAGERDSDGNRVEAASFPKK